MRVYEALQGDGCPWGGALEQLLANLANQFLTHPVFSEYSLKCAPANSGLWFRTTAFHCSKHRLFLLPFEHILQNCTEFWAARGKRRLAPSLNNNIFFGCSAQSETSGTHSAPVRLQLGT